MQGAQQRGIRPGIGAEQGVEQRRLAGCRVVKRPLRGRETGPSGATRKQQRRSEHEKQRVRETGLPVFHKKARVSYLPANKVRQYPQKR